MEKGEKTPEKASRWIRNIHLAIGAAAIAGAVLIPPAAPAFEVLALWEGAHAALWEGIRRVARGRKKGAEAHAGGGQVIHANFGAARQHAAQRQAA